MQQHVDNVSFLNLVRASEILPLRDLIQAHLEPRVQKADGYDSCNLAARNDVLVASLQVYF